MITADQRQADSEQQVRRNQNCVKVAVIANGFLLTQVGSGEILSFEGHSDDTVARVLDAVREWIEHRLTSSSDELSEPLRWRQDWRGSQSAPRRS